VSQSAAGLKEAHAALESFQKEAGVEIVGKQQEVCLTRMAELQAERTKVEADLADVNGNLTSLEKDLREQPPTLKTSRALVEDQAYQQAMAKASHADIAGLLGVNMQTEELNPTYSFLQEKLVEARRDASGLTARKRELDRLLVENDQTLAKVQNELTEKTARLETLTRTYELERDAYKTLRSRLQAANVEVVSKTSLLKVVDAALPPQRHIRPRKGLNTALGGAAGFFGMVMLAFFFDYVQRAQRAPRRAAS
jgi:succinoglycan biosynthesis transport protein ExoP